jgi:uncharacterized protein
MNDKYQRPIVSEIVEKLRDHRPILLILQGPRRVGKTTAIFQALAQFPKDSGVYLSTDQPSSGQSDDDFLRAGPAQSERPPSERTTSWLIDQWRSARRATTGYSTAQSSKQQPFILIIDEIQKIQNWSEDVKGLFDEDRANGIAMHVVLLGSAPLQLASGLSESLAGRFEAMPVTHWTFDEMQECFGYSVEQYIYFGGYPEPARRGIGDEGWWRAYITRSIIEPVISTDILAHAKVEKPALFRQLFELACSYSSQITALTKLQGSLNDAGNVTTLAGYLELLKSAGLIVGLGKYTAGEIKRRRSPPKLQVLNTAFHSTKSLYDFAGAQNNHEHWGRLVESAVGAHLFNSIEYDPIKLSYWREAPDEVDFVLEASDQLCIFEVKSGDRYDYPTRAFDNFGATFKTKTIRRIVIGPRNIPIEEALRTRACDWFKL